MSTEFIEDFTGLCMEWSSSVCVACRRESEEYQELDREQAELFRTIKEKLGEDRKLMSRYEELENAKASLDWRWECRVAYQNCLRLLRWMGAFE